MKSVSLGLRKAFYSALDNHIIYNTVSIPTFEQEVQETPTKKMADVNGYKVYCLIKNQSDNDNSSKQLRNDEANIQVHICSEYPVNKGNSELSELVSELVMARLITANGLFKNIAMAEPFKLWKMDLVATNNLIFDSNSARVYTTVLTFLAHINQS